MGQSVFNQQLKDFERVIFARIDKLERKVEEKFTQIQRKIELLNLKSKNPDLKGKHGIPEFDVG